MVNKVEAIIKEIQEADEMEILEFDFEPCFKLMREMENKLDCGISKRERYLMQEAMNAAAHCTVLDKWISTMTDTGNTVGQHLNEDADIYSQSFPEI